MNHIFEQKLVNEQIALQNALTQQNKKLKELMEQVQAYDLMLEDFAVSYLENGGSPEELQELFDMVGMKEKGKTIIGKVASGAKKTAKAVGHGILAASLIASPATITSKKTIPGKPGTPAQAAVIEKGKPAVTRSSFGTGKALSFDSARGFSNSGTYDSFKEIEFTGGKHEGDRFTPSTGGPPMSANDVGRAVQHMKTANGSFEEQPPHVQELMAAHAKMTGGKAPGSPRTVEVSPGTPDKVIKPAVPAVSGTPSTTKTTASLTAVPNRSEYEQSKGLPKVMEIGKRRRREGPIDVTPVSATSTPIPSSGGSGETSRSSGGSSIPRGGSGPIPQRTPSPSPSPTPAPVKKPKFPVSSVPGRISQAVGTRGTGTPAYVGKVPPGPPRRWMEESVEQTIRNILTEG